MRSVGGKRRCVTDAGPFTITCPRARSLRSDKREALPAAAQGELRGSERALAVPSRLGPAGNPPMYGLEREAAARERAG